MIYSGKKVAVLGLGSSGEAAARLLAEEGGEPVILESARNAELLERATRLGQAGFRVILGPDADRCTESFDLAVTSPGIDLAADLPAQFLARGIPVIAEIELAFRECLCPVVAITGTNGKTTTTELTTRILNQCGVRAMACGNIGIPFSEAVQSSGSLDVMVVEVSSFQLETIVDFHPAVSAWLNFSPNHLDRYPGVEAYRHAKLRIFENQQATDHAVVNARSDLPVLAASTTTFSAVEEQADFHLRHGWIHYRQLPVLEQSTTRLPGPHNAENIMAAFGIGTALGVEISELASAVADYAPPSHRCELVGAFGSVTWINDSKSTNLDALTQAIRSVHGRLILIAGGKDKGFDFDPVAGLAAERVDMAILIGEMRHRIADSWTTTHCVPADSLEEAVRLAHLHATPGTTVLFSPGTSSFDMFRNYSERGDAFKEAVRIVSSNPPSKQKTTP